MNFEPHRRAGARQERRVAGKLDGVAEALLGMQQDGAVRRADIRRARAARDRNGAYRTCRCASSAIRIRQSLRQACRASRATAPGWNGRRHSPSASAIALPKLSTASAWRLSACSARPRLFQALTWLGAAASARSKLVERVGLAAERGKRIAAIVENFRMQRRQRQRGVEIGQRLGMAAEHGLRRHRGCAALHHCAGRAA